jgi:phosphatidate cytidylyltransferase
MPEIPAGPLPPADGGSSPTGPAGPPEPKGHPTPPPAPGHPGGVGHPGALEHAAEVVGQHLDTVNRKAGRDLPAAVGVSVVLVGAIVASLTWWSWGFALIMAAGLCLGVWELDRAWRDRAGIRPAREPLLVGGVVMILGAYAAACGDLPWSPGAVIVGALALTAVVCLLWRLPAGAAGYTKDVAASFFILVYPILLGSTMILMMVGEGGSARIVLFILCVVGSDTGGWVVGVLFGKHAMAPAISPKKSWEGLVGSFVLAGLVGLGVGWLILEVPWWRALLIAWSITIAGVLGDLVESVVKRDFKVKDLGSLLPGHGGVMDRIDSYLVAAPVAWLATINALPYG